MYKQAGIKNRVANFFERRSQLNALKKRRKEGFKRWAEREENTRSELKKRISNQKQKDKFGRKRDRALDKREALEREAAWRENGGKGKYGKKSNHSVDELRNGVAKQHGAAEESFTSKHALPIAGGIGAAALAGSGAYLYNQKKKNKELANKIRQRQMQMIAYQQRGRK